MLKRGRLTLATLLGITGYAITVLGFVFMFLLLLATRKRSLQRTILLLLAAFTSVWALSAALQIEYQLALSQHLATETLRNSSWFLLLISLLADKQNIWQVITLNFTTKLLAGFLLLIVILEFTYPWFLWLSFRNTVLLYLAQSIIGLWLIEQLFRRTDRNSRWEIKPLCLGLGLSFAYDFALYANGILSNTLDTGFWYGRGWVALLTLPLILLTTRRIKNGSTRVYVSRDVVYHSTLLMVAGSYLLIMAISGYYIRYVGGTWGDMAQNVFFALSSLILVSLFLSDSLRRNLKVLITKHFYANKYEYRQEWMNFSSILKEETQSPYQVALNALTRPFQCEYAILATMEGNRLKPQCYSHPNAKVYELDDTLEALAASAINHSWIVDIGELKQGNTKTPFPYNSQAVSKVVTFSHIVPIISKNGISSAVFLSPPKSTHQLNWEDRDLMWAISSQLAFYLNLYHSNQALAENQQFDAFNRMSAFLAHDLKNILAQLQLLAKNGKQHRNNPEFIDDAFETIDSAVLRLTKVVDHLRKKNQPDNINVSETFSLDTVIQSVCNNRKVNLPAPDYISHNPEPIFITADKERFCNVLSHIIQNAQEATNEEGSVMVESNKEEQYYTIRITDNGIGMSADFIEDRLFKPFDTTKGNSGMGIGAYDAKKLIEQLKGYIDVQSEPGKGSCFTMRIPIPIPG